MKATASLFLSATVLIAACGVTRPGGSGSLPRTSIAPPSTTSAVTTVATTPPPSSVTTTTTSPVAPFVGQAAALSAGTRSLMVGNTWHTGCPVGLDDLRLVTLSYWGFDGAVHTGQLVLNADSVAPVVQAFRALYRARSPIHGMRLVDYYSGDDERSMAADNTSAFNCRLVPGTSTWSQHAYGRAVDINPLENPEIRNGQVDPPSAWPWANRLQSRTAMIRHGDLVWQAFASVGWRWGGDWTSLKDYMHFSANGL